MNKKHFPIGHDLTKIFAATQKFVCSLMLLFLLTAMTGQNVIAANQIYVDASATGLNNGTSWANAYTSLETAIAANIDQSDIRVAGGIYKPTIVVGGTGARYAAFQMKNGVSIYGGYNARTGEQIDYFPGGANETILSGDIGVIGDASDNCYHVVHNPDGIVLNTNSRLKCLTISGGNANYNSSVTPHMFLGGGVYNGTKSNAQFYQCVFSKNSAGYGGGIYFINTLSNIVENCTFVSNRAISNGSNTGYGGGIYVTTKADVSFYNCLIINNSADATGGGIYVYSSSSANAASVLIVNCTIANNHANYCGGIRLWDYSSALIGNSIIWGNTHDVSSKGRQIAVTSTSKTKGINNGLMWNYSHNNTIKNGTNDIDMHDINTSTTFFDDPQFVNPAKLDFRIFGTSPCVNTGTDANYSGGMIDVRLQSRDQDRNGDKFMGKIDRGAYEYTLGLDPDDIAKGEVVTQAVTNIKANSATGLGSYETMGSTNPTQHGHCWGTSKNPTTANSKTELGIINSTREFSSAITGLIAGTTYYVRAYSTNASGTTYGKEIKFTAREIIITGTLIPFVTCGKNPSELQSFRVSGSGLFSRIEITAPPGFEIKVGHEYIKTCYIYPNTNKIVTNTSIDLRANDQTGGYISGQVTVSSYDIATQYLQVTKPANESTFSASGNSFNLKISCSVNVTVVSTGNSYIFTIDTGTWTGSAAGAIVNGNVLTISQAGLNVYDIFNIEDLGTGTSVIFGNSGANRYNDQFNVVLDNNAGTVVLPANSTTSFSGNNGLNVTTDRDILFTDHSYLTTENGNISLSANMQANNSLFDGDAVKLFLGSKIEATGSGIVTVKGKATYGNGISINNGSSLIGGTTGTLTLEGTASMNGVYLFENSSISSHGANINVTSSANDSGVKLVTSTISSGGNGSVLVNGNENWSLGIHLDRSVITSGGGGKVELNGTGSGQGIYIDKSSVNSGGGNVVVNGIGGGSSPWGGDENYGIYILNAGLIKAGGNGSVTVTGQGGNNSSGGGKSNFGIRIDGDPLVDTDEITSTNGNVVVTGTGGGVGNSYSSLNHGIYLYAGGNITSGGNTSTVSVTGTGGGSIGASGIFNNYGIFLDNSSATHVSKITSGGGNVFVTGISGSNTPYAINLSANSVLTTAVNGGNLSICSDDVNFTEGAVVSARSTGSITLAPYNANVGIDLGEAYWGHSYETRIHLSQTELQLMSAGTMNIGNTSSGNIIFKSFYPNNLIIPSNLNLACNANSVIYPYTKLDNSGKTTTFSPGTSLSIEINNTTDCSSLNVLGNINLSGLNLLLSGNYIPDGETYTIVSGLNITGIFNGHANGSVISFNGKDLRINYSSTAVTLTDDNAVITVTGNLTLFPNCPGDLSSQQSFVVSGIKLTSGIVITAPTGFEVSTTSGSNFTNSLTLSQNAGITPATTIYVRLSGALSGYFTGNIVVSSTGSKITNIVASSSTGASFYVNGTKLTADIISENNYLRVESTGSSYTFTLNNGTWCGSAYGASVNGKTLTISSAGLSTYNTFEIIDDAPGSIVTFGKPGITGTYYDNFIVTLDAAKGLDFNGPSYFTGSNSIIASAHAFHFYDNAKLSTVDGELSLISNLTTIGLPDDRADGIIINNAVVEATGVGAVTIKGRSTLGQHAGVDITSGGKIMGGISGQLIVEGNGATTSELPGNYGIALSGGTSPNYSTIGSYGADIVIKGTGGGIRCSGVSINKGIIKSGGTGTVSVIGSGGNLVGLDSYGSFGIANSGQITSSGGNVVVNGTGGNFGSGSNNNGIGLSDGGMISAVGTGSVTVSGKGGSSNILGNYGGNSGIVTDGNSIIKSENGNVVVSGIGGDGGTIGGNCGVNFSGGRITSTGADASITITGVGGASTGGNNAGISAGTGVVYNSIISSNISGGGQVTLSGTGGGTGASSGNVGLYISQGTITSGNNGNLSITGIGGNNTIGGSGGDNFGIYSPFSSNISSNNGSVMVKGIGGGAGGSGSNNHGINLRNSSIITSSGLTASVNVEGSGGNSTGTLNHGITMYIATITSGGGEVYVAGNVGGPSTTNLALDVIEGSSIVTNTNGGNLTIRGNSMNFPWSSVRTKSTYSLNLLQKTDAVSFELGTALADIGNGPIRLNNTEIGYLSGGTINFGDSNTGNITINPAVTTTSNLKLTTNTNYGVICSAIGTDLFMTGKTLSFTSGTPLKIAINGATVDSQYDQLKVTGIVNLSGAVLNLSGTHFPALGNVFTIVSGTSLTGNFNGLAEGSLITINGKQLRVNYTTTTVTLTMVIMPAVYVNGTINSFSTISGSVSAVQSYLVSGNDLTSNISVVAPTGFEISTTSGSNFSGSLTLTQSGGTVTSTTIFVRLANTASGNPSGNITLTSTGAMTQNLPVSGTVSEAVSSVVVPLNNIYKAPQNLDFTVNYSSAITVTGMPFIPLTLGIGGVVNASYFSGSGTNVLIFRYTIANGNADTDGVSLGSSISLNGGTMKNSLGTNASLTLNNVASTLGVRVDAIVPTVTITSTSSATTSVSPIPVTIVFSEPVSGLSASEITVTNATAGNLSGSGTTYIASITPTGPGTVTVNIAASVAMDAAGNNNTAATQLSRVYIMAPSVTTNAAGSVIPNGATLNGSVNANNANTTVTFEYGTSTSYGSAVTAEPSSVTGLTSTTVSKVITGLASNTTYYYRVKGENAAGTSYGLDQTFTTTSLATLTVSGTLSPFAACQGSISAEQSFTVSGSNLSSNISISAPTGFAISKTSDSTFSGSLTLTQTGGTVSTTTIYVRMQSTATGNPSGSISILSAGATDRSVAVSGAVTTPVVPSFLVTAVPATRTVCAGSPVTLTASDANNDLSFDGSNDYVNIGDVNELDGATQFTIEAMVYATSSSQYKTIFSKRVDHNNKIQIYFGSSGQLTFAIGNVNVMEGSMTTPLLLNNWNHIAAIYNASGATNADKMKIYLNGLQKTLSFNGTMPASIAVNSISALIGIESAPATACFTGKMNDFRIWNIARSDAQISASSNNCLSGSITGLVAEYKFNEATGSSIAHNSQGTGYDGTLVNMNTATAWNTSASGCETDLGFSWSDGISNGTSFIPSKSGTYTLTATSTNACSVASQSVDITVNARPMPTISGNSTVLIGSIGNVYTTEASMTGYIWSVSAGGTITSGGTSTSNTATITWNTAGDKTVGVNYTSSSCTGISSTLHNVTVSIPPPVVTLVGTIIPFANCAGSVSQEQSFTVSGSNLTGNISLSAPAGFEISKTSGSTFSGSLTLTHTGGTVSTTTIYVRMQSSATGSPSGSISVISAGATDRTVAVSGAVTTPVVPSFLVTTIPATLTVCAGSPVTLTASDANNDLRFDGSNDYVNLGDINELDGATQFTIEAMVYATSSSQYKTIFSKRLDHNNKIQIFFGSSGQLTFAIGNVNVIEASMTSIPLNNWNHIAAVYNASGATNADKMKIYLNGVQKTLSFNGTMPASIAVNSAPSLIGSESVSPLSAVCYAGKMNDFRIWNTARTNAQISASSNACIGGSTTGLIAEYKFNEASGNSIAHNSNGSAYHGTLVNMNAETAWNASASGCATGLNFAWSNGITNGVPFIPTTSGTYTLTATGSGLCQNTATESVEIAVHPLPVPTISGNSEVIIGSTGHVYTTEPSMSGYTWSVSVGGTITSGGTSTSNTATIRWNSSGDQTVGVNYTNSKGCKASSPKLYDVKAFIPSWTGASNNEWNNATNWSNGILPTASDNLIITNVTNDPVISGEELAICNNLTLEPDAVLIVRPGKTLTVKSVLTNNSVGGIILESDATGTGSLIAGTLAGTGTAIAQSYLTTGRWHLVSASVIGQAIKDFLIANNNVATNGTIRGMMDYNPVTNSWNSYFNNETSGSLGGGKGFSMRSATNNIVVHTAPLLAGDFTVPNLVADKWNCVGNPYSSAIGINTLSASSKKFITENASSLDSQYGAIYIWEQPDAENGKSGKYTTVSNVPTPGSGVDIQQGQAFMIKMRAGQTSLTFTPSMQFHGPTLLLKSTGSYWPYIKLKASGNDQTVSTLIAFNNSMTNGLDPSYDAGLLKGDAALLVYTKLVEDNGTPFAIQALPETYSSLVIPLGVDSKTGGEITFSAETFDLPASCSVTLEDKLAKTFTSLADDATYKATVSAGTTAVGRFYIHTNSSTTGTSELSSGVFSLKAYPANGQIWIIGEVASGAKASLFDAAGRNLGIFNLQEGSRNSISSAGLASGVYLLNVTDAEKRFNTKIIIY